jgi:hypothetical protein
MCFALNIFPSNCFSNNSQSVRIRQEINNLAIPTDCGLCKQRFVPTTGLHSVLSPSKRPVCPSCAEGAIDVTSPAEREKNQADLARFEALYSAPQYVKAA